MSEYCKNCEALQQENAKLKEELKKYINDKFCQGGCICYQFDTIEKYKQALDEIEGIVNKKTEIPICDECAYRNIPECKENCMQDVLGKILDIISKAKGEQK